MWVVFYVSIHFSLLGYCTIGAHFCFFHMIMAIYKSWGYTCWYFIPEQLDIHIRALCQPWKWEAVRLDECIPAEEQDHQCTQGGVWLIFISMGKDFNTFTLHYFGGLYICTLGYYRRKPLIEYKSQRHFGVRICLHFESYIYHAKK